MATTTTTTSTTSSRKRKKQKEPRLRNKRWEKLDELDRQKLRYRELSAIIEAERDYPKQIAEYEKHITQRRLEIVKVPAHTEERPGELELPPPSLNCPWLELPPTRTAEDLGYYPHQDFAPPPGISSVPDYNTIHDCIWSLRIVFIDEKVKKKKKQKIKTEEGSDERTGQASREVILPSIERPLNHDGETNEVVKVEDEMAANTKADNDNDINAAIATAPKMKKNVVKSQKKDIAEEETAKPEPSPLLRLPFELRRLIYEDLLTRERPRRLYDSWRRVWKNRGRDRLPLDIDILRTCKRVYKEALPVLYGCNTFEYIIRDAGHTMEINGDRLTVETGEQDEEAESEYEANEPRNMRGRGRRRRGHDAPKFNIKRFGRFIRKISIVAESGRHKPEVLARMAEAVCTFDARRHLNEGWHLDTLSISVEPISNEPTPEEIIELGHKYVPKERGERYSFTDFFESDSALLNAIRLVDCRFFQLNISRKSLPRPPWTREHVEAEEDVARFTIDMRARRALLKASFGGDTLWSGDRLRMPTLRLKGQAVYQALVLLKEYFILACEHSDNQVDSKQRLKAGLAMESRQDDPASLSWSHLAHIVYKESQRKKRVQNMKTVCRHFTRTDIDQHTDCMNVDEGSAGSSSHSHMAAEDNPSEVRSKELLTLAKSMIQARFNSPW